MSKNPRGVMTSRWFCKATIPLLYKHVNLINNRAAHGFVYGFIRSACACGNGDKPGCKQEFAGDGYDTALICRSQKTPLDWDDLDMPMQIAFETLLQHRLS